MMVEGHKMDLIYYDPYPNTKLEQYVTDYGAFLAARGERAVTVKRLETMGEVLQQADVRLLLFPCPGPLTRLCSSAQ